MKRTKVTDDFEEEKRTFEELFDEEINMSIFKSSSTNTIVDIEVISCIGIIPAILLSMYENEKGLYNEMKNDYEEEYPQAINDWFPITHPRGIHHLIKMYEKLGITENIFNKARDELKYWGIIKTKWVGNPPIEHVKIFNINIAYMKVKIRHPELSLSEEV